MPEQPTSAEAKANAEEIKGEEATEHGSRGNVHSEPEPPVDQDAPPPLPN